MRSILRSRSALLIFAIAVIVGASAAWYYYNEQYLEAQAAPPTETIKTAQVQRGNYSGYERLTDL